MGRKKINPPRRRTKEQERMDYRKQLTTRQVTSTAETTTKTPLVEELNSTDKVLPIEQAPIPREPTAEGLKLTKTHLIISIIMGIIAILGIVVTVVYNYTSLKEGLNHTNSDLRELKQAINERINRLEERTDKYIYKEKNQNK